MPHEQMCSSTGGIGYGAWHCGELSEQKVNDWELCPTFFVLTPSAPINRQLAEPDLLFHVMKSSATVLK